MDKQLKHEAQMEQFRSVIQMASMSLRTAILINGGAAIAILTFLGNSQQPYCAAYLVASLQVFAIGVAAAAFATVLGYFAQNRHLTSIQNDETEYPGKKLGIAAAALVLLSNVGFVAGTIIASFGFGTI
jgi:hypothetical protein